MKNWVVAAAVAVLVAVSAVSVWYYQESPQARIGDAGQPAAGDVALQEGVHYVRVAPPEGVVISSPYVQEFFSYGCSHCKAFAPLLKTWQQAHPQVRVDYVPVVWNDNMKLLAGLYFAVQDRPDFAQAHAAIFDFIANADSAASPDERNAGFAALLQAQNIDPQQLRTLVNATESGSPLGDAMALGKHYAIDSTPTLVVNGEYKLLNSGFQTFGELLGAVDTLLAKSPDVE